MTPLGAAAAPYAPPETARPQVPSPPPAPRAAGGPDAPPEPGFAVTLENFSGPFDVLLGLISKHRLDITEVSLATVTDEFIAYIRELRERVGDEALDETTQFMVLASTLLDLKAARLLPSGEVESDEDIARLEARDLLFARLLQYKAFKVVAGQLAERLEAESASFPRRPAPDPRFAALLPELLWRTSLADFADLAGRALAPKPAVPTEVGLDHLHAPPVSVREQADLLAGLLRNGGGHSFRSLVSDAASIQEVVARFLALLEMFRDRVVDFDQDAPLGELTVRWDAAGRDWDAGALREEFDAEPAAAAHNDDAGPAAPAVAPGEEATP
ncbi:segregation and condensation protein A [Arthrobacter halodurans]|uniref:Segregation and condensation protein A n=1 Tax=Arthrobacter halodurans TaxID=516699 RepID=A0ABV4UP91_9MICC